MPVRLQTSSPDFATAFKALVEQQRDTLANVDADVAAILAEVAKRGDDAVIEYSKRFDRIELTPVTMRVGAAEVADAVRACSPETIAALRQASERIDDYHRRQMPENFDYVDAIGVKLGSRWRPVEAAGLYVPGGTAAYPSSVLMNAIPAKVAGVDRLVMVVPTPDGKTNPLVLAAASLCGIEEIWRIGGAQAIGALAYGTATIRPVDKIVGPGNAWVTAAKRQVFGTVGIDMIAGPSEILVVADAENDPAWIAADLLSQAEHDPSAQSILISNDADFIRAVEAELARTLATLPRIDTARKSWEEHGATILVRDWDEAIPLVDALAPEHLELALTDADALAEKIRNAGAIFLGRHTPEAIGDYIAGPNHVLPTSRSARFASGLGVQDFLKRTSLVRCDAANLALIGPPAVALARAEGLDAHALSISIRLGSGN